MKGRWQRVTYFNVSLANRPGELARFADQLHAEGIDLLGLWGFATEEDEPELCCVPRVPGALRAWANTVGLPLREGQALYLHDENRPGMLVETLDRVAAAGINIIAVECVAAGEGFGWFLWAEPGDMEDLEEMLL
ncbi:MAG: hypothetical protein SYC29_18430 [Planctomycetota bacterium]|nr:hypothetical protein [Planctomycetota bacterium]